MLLIQNRRFVETYEMVVATAVFGGLGRLNLTIDLEID